MNAAARPFKDEEDRQTEVVQFKCTKQEKKEVIALAKAHGINQFSVFCRLASLGIVQVDRTKLDKKKKCPK